MNEYKVFTFNDKDSLERCLTERRKTINFEVVGFSTCAFFTQVQFTVILLEKK